MRHVERLADEMAELLDRESRSARRCASSGASHDYKKRSV